MSKTVAILEPGYADYGVERALLEPLGATVVPVPAHDDAVSALTKLNPVAVMVRERSVSAAEIGCCPELKLIVRYGIGVDNVDLQAAVDRRVYVANVPEYGAEHEVSDHAVALYLAVQRRIVERDRQVRGGAWDIGQTAPIPGRDNAVLGLIGLGRIGVEAARKFGALGFTRTLVVDPHIDPDTIRARGMQPVDLDELCREADVISLHVPLLPETRHILNAARLEQMKPTTIIINVSRGGLIDELALADALGRGRLFGAGLDVFEQEPIPPDHPLLSAANTVLTDHAAWYSERSVSVLQHGAASEVKRVLSGDCPQNWINKWAG